MGCRYYLINNDKIITYTINKYMKRIENKIDFKKNKLYYTRDFGNKILLKCVNTNVEHSAMFIIVYPEMYSKKYNYNYIKNYFSEIFVKYEKNMVYYECRKYNILLDKYKRLMCVLQVKLFNILNENILRTINEYLNCNVYEEYKLKLENIKVCGYEEYKKYI